MNEWIFTTKPPCLRSITLCAWGFHVKRNLFCFQGMYHRTVSYKDLYEMYHENKDVMDKSVFFFQSSVVDMENIGDLFTVDVRDALPHSEGVTVHWYVNHDVYCLSVIGHVLPIADIKMLCRTLKDWIVHNPVLILRVKCQYRIQTTESQVIHHK